MINLQHKRMIEMKQINLEKKMLRFTYDSGLHCHWTSYFGISFPDKELYRLITEYAKVENAVLGKLDNQPVTRPWIQDFDAPWLYSGNGRSVKKYGKKLRNKYEP